MRCAFLTTDDLAGYVEDDDLARAALRLRGHQVEAVSWRSRADWDAFVRVVVRTTWDFQLDPQAFLASLEAIDRSAAHLSNPLALMRWNMDKRYLLELEAQGHHIIPTRLLEHVDRSGLASALADCGSDELVAKPLVGATASGCRRLHRARFDQEVEAVAASFAGRPALLQPFLPSVPAEGELSLVFFAGEPSHALVKEARAEEWRVQQEYGGSIRPVDAPADAWSIGRSMLEGLPERTLYARVDLVRDLSGAWALMELELIEPALYFGIDPLSPARFAAALER
jgi:hypothetical protein